MLDGRPPGDRNPWSMSGAGGGPTQRRSPREPGEFRQATRRQRWPKLSRAFAPRCLPDWPLRRQVGSLAGETLGMCLRAARNGHPGPPPDPCQSPQCTAPRADGDQRPVDRGTACCRDWVATDSGQHAPLTWQRPRILVDSAARRDWSLMRLRRAAWYPCVHGCTSPVTTPVQVHVP